MRQSLIDHLNDRYTGLGGRQTEAVVDAFVEWLRQNRYENPDAYLVDEHWQAWHELADLLSEET